MGISVGTTSFNQVIDFFEGLKEKRVNMILNNDKHVQGVVIEVEGPMLKLKPVVSSDTKEFYVPFWAISQLTLS